MLKKLLRKVDAYLRNEPFYEESDELRLVPMDDEWWEWVSGQRDPIRTKIYWSTYRTFRRIKNAPSDAYYAVKYFIQRGSRGWSDRDTWSLDYYLNSWMPAALRHLKEHKHGTPISVFPTEPQYMDDTGNFTDEAHKIAEARWDEIMDKMIAAFEAGWRIDDGLYDKELGPYPLVRPEGMSKEGWARLRDDRFQAVRRLEERDEAIFKEGMALFVAHYRSLWD